MLCANCISNRRRFEKSGRCKTARPIHSKNTISFKAKTTTKPRPHGSWVVGQSGGDSKPPAFAAKRNNHPLGASKSATPIANAACGSANIAGTLPTHRPDNSTAAPTHASAVDATLVQRLKPKAVLSCGCVSRACHAAPSHAAVMAPNKLHAKGSKTSAAKPAAKQREAKREKTSFKVITSGCSRPRRPHHRQTCSHAAKRIALDQVGLGHGGLQGVYQRAQGR